MRMPRVTFKNAITSRVGLVNIILVTNTLVWYFYAFTILSNIAKNLASDHFTILLMWGLHFVGAIFSALFGAIWINKRGKQTIFLISWVAFGVISSLASLIANIADTPGLLVLSFLFGVAFGSGMPTCMGYFSNHTSVENRGRLAGIIVFANGLGMLLLGTAVGESFTTKALVLAGWRMIGLVLFLLIKPHEESEEKTKKESQVSFRFVLGQRSFILYLIPWILFSLVNYLSQPVLANILDPSLIEFSISVENVITGIFAIVAGFLIDFFGRKHMATAGFVMLGIGYTILGIAPENLLSLYFYTVLDGVAWGILFVIFVIIVWGDLSYGASSDKYYAIAGIPFFVSLFLRSAIGLYVSNVSPYAIFSFTAFFLFLAVLPLMYAPETLPEKTMKDRELKNYIAKAQKAVEKAQKKEAENALRESGDSEIESDSEAF